MPPTAILFAGQGAQAVGMGKDIAAASPAAAAVFEQANEVVSKLLEKYEEEIEKAPTGKRYQECYDLKTGKASEEYLRLYDEVKEELTKMGIPL